MMLGCLPLILILWLLFMLPLFFADAMLTALAKLGINRQISLLLVIWIFLGSFINIPVRRIERTETVEWPSSFLYGFNRLFLNPLPNYTIIAVNVGGCVIPGLVTLYELARLANIGASAVLTCFLVVLLNIAVCHRFARPVPHLGIMIPMFIPPLVAASGALILYPHFAPPIAFCAGVLGPLVGADLFHLREVQKTSMGMVSIGGAGTFDGIILSGLIATLLA